MKLHRSRRSLVLGATVARRLVPALTALSMGTGAAAQTTVVASAHPEENGGFGSAVASVADFNGDGTADVAVGAFNQTVGNIPSAGRVTIYSGAPGNAATVLKVLTSPNHQALGWFGSAVARVPDVNGDGRGDILVGAYNEGNAGAPDTGFGRAYLFDGATGALLRTITSPNAEPGGGFGCSVAGITDVTGDGRGDLVIGAFREDPNLAPDDAGRAYIFNGATGALYRTLVAPGQSANGHFGIAVAPVPDANGDGHPEVVIGAPGESPGGVSGGGRAYVFDAFTGQVYKTLISASPQAMAGFGSSVSGVPDANGDARGDVVVGSPMESNAGRVFLFSGASGARLRTFFAGSSEAGDLFGSAVAGLDDIDGDGRGDIAIGAAHADRGAAPPDAGRAYIFSGANYALLRVMDSPNQQEDGAFGTSIAAVPDVNGNGKGDLVVGAPVEDTPFIQDVGRGYLIRN